MTGDKSMPDVFSPAISGSTLNDARIAVERNNNNNNKRIPRSIALLTVDYVRIITALIELILLTLKEM